MYIYAAVYLTTNIYVLGHHLTFISHVDHELSTFVQLYCKQF